MACPECGYEMDDLAFCPKCGSPNPHPVILDLTYRTNIAGVNPKAPGAVWIFQNERVKVSARFRRAVSEDEARRELRLDESFKCIPLEMERTLLGGSLK